MNSEQLDEQYPDFNYDSIIRETNAAILFDIYGDGTTKPIWLPKSQMEHDVENCSFNIPRWLAEEKELI